MTQEEKELIKQEIESYKESMKGLEPHSDFRRRQITAYNQIMQFINSLPEEPAREDINEELERIAYSLPHSATGFWPKDIDPKSVEARTKYGVHHDWSYEQVMNIARHFAEWQKNKMKEALQTEYEKGRFDMREEIMKDAIESIVEDWCGDTPEITIPLNPQDFKTGDKVKIIIVKEEQQ